jgi:hypothetical protein
VRHPLSIPVRAEATSMAAVTNRQEHFRRRHSFVMILKRFLTMQKNQSALLLIVTMILYIYLFGKE